MNTRWQHFIQAENLLVVIDPGEERGIGGVQNSTETN